MIKTTQYISFNSKHIHNTIFTQWKFTDGEFFSSQSNLLAAFGLDSGILLHLSL